MSSTACKKPKHVHFTAEAIAQYQIQERRDLLIHTRARTRYNGPSVLRQVHKNKFKNSIGPLPTLRKEWFHIFQYGQFDMWNLGMMFPQGLTSQLEYVKELCDRNSGAFPVTNNWEWRRGHIRCKWPMAFSGYEVDHSSDHREEDNELKEVDEKHIGGPSPFSQRRFASEGCTMDSERNLEKLFESIKDPKKQRVVRKAVTDHTKEYANLRPNCRSFETATCEQFTKNPVVLVNNAVASILNAIFGPCGLQFDTLNSKKTESFADENLCFQLNVRISHRLFSKYVASEDMCTTNTGYSGAARSNKTRPISKKPIPTQIKPENTFKDPTCVTLYVCAVSMPSFGFAYGALSNCGVENIPNVNPAYAPTVEEDGERAARKCRLEHYHLSDRCAKLAIDRHCHCQMTSDIALWQFSHLSHSPDFASWKTKKSPTEVNMPDTNDCELAEAMDEYPVARQEQWFMTLSETGDILYKSLCCAVNAVFEAIPMLNDDDFLARVVNPPAETCKGISPELGHLVRELNHQLRSTILTRAPLFIDYAEHYHRYGHYTAGPVHRTGRVMNWLPAKDINSCTIVRNTSTDCEQTYMVQIDRDRDYRAYELRMYEPRNCCYADKFNRHVIQGMDDFKHYMSTFHKEGVLYDFGKLNYCDEYGIEHTRMFTLSEYIAKEPVRAEISIEPGVVASFIAQLKDRFRGRDESEMSSNRKYDTREWPWK